MLQVLLGGMIEHLFAEEYHSRGKLPLVTAHEPFHVGVHVRRTYRRVLGFHTVVFQLLFELCRERGVVVQDQNRRVVFTAGDRKGERGRYSDLRATFVIVPSLSRQPRLVGELLQ